jgi:hypothetical protein
MTKSWLAFLGFALLLLSRESAAQEIRILDLRGLTRAIQTTGQPLGVEVEVVTVEGRSLGGAVLVQTSGLAEDRVGAEAGSAYRFTEVPPGTWQVKLNDGGEQIRTVRIIK